MSSPTDSATPQPTPTAPTWDPETPLARMAGETATANKALNDYALMGAGRSLDAIRRQYLAQRQAGGSPKPPTTQLATLKNWSSRHHWQARVATWQDHQNEAERQLWAERSKQARQSNWRAAEAGQALVLEVLIEQAPRLIRSSRRIVSGGTRTEKRGGKDVTIETEREIITAGLDANALTRLGDYVLKAQEAALQTHRKASGTEDDPVHTVALSLADWKAQQAERRAAALETLAEFGEGEGVSG